MQGVEPAFTYKELLSLSSIFNRMNEIKGSSALIIGYGREGKSVESWLKLHYNTMRIAVSDSTSIPKEAFDTVIRSPGVSPYTLHVSGHVTTPTNIFFSLVSGRTIGVTGTKGKSTTASLIAHILSAVYPDVRLVGNIGVPMLDELDSSTKDTVFVVELSSHQLSDIRYSPHIAVVLGIVPEHLDYYPDFDSYRRAKENIFRFQKPGDHIVRNGKERVPFKTNLLGNEENISAAVSASRLMKVPEEIIRKQLLSFVSLPHRLEYAGEFCGIRFYNDSLSTIPEAAIHALDALGPDVTTLIAGGFDRGLSYEVLGKRLAKSSVRTLILFPDTGEKIWKSIPKKSLIKKFDVHSMEEAVRIAKVQTPEGKICLLSPASASFNLFRDYVDRGEQFKEWVKRLGTS